MNSRIAGRLASLLVVVVLLASALMFLGSLVEAQSDTVQGVVRKLGSPATLLNGTKVTLVDAHGQLASLVSITGLDGTFTFRPTPGFYFIKAERAGYFDNETSTFRFDGTKTLDFDPLYLQEMPSRSYELNVTVKDAFFVPIQGANVTLRNLTKDQTIEVKAANSTGVAKIMTWKGDFELRVEKDTYEKYVNPSLSIVGNTNLSVVLNKGIKVVGIARSAEGSFISKGLTSVLYNLDGGVPFSKKLIRATVAGSSYTFYAYPGNFTLIVDADGYAANTTQIKVESADLQVDRTLSAPDRETIETSFVFIQDDWNNITMYRNLTLNADSKIDGLDYDFVRNVRLQIDLALGNRNGVLEASEQTAFVSWLHNTGPKNVTTDGLFTINGKAYISKMVDSSTDYSVTASFLPSGKVWINSSANHTVRGATVPLNQAKYFLNLTGKHDTSNAAYVDYSYQLKLPKGYERNATSKSGNVTISGYLDVRIDPGVATGSPKANIIAERALAGTARARIISPLDRVHLLNESYLNYTAIVPIDVNITFSAEDSTDPNTGDGRVRPDANFSWELKKDPIQLKSFGMKPVMKIAEMGNYTGNLTVTETGGNVTFRQFFLKVDGIKPVAKLENNVTGLGIPANGTSITVNEDVSITFVAVNSTDMIHPAMAGIIEEYNWDFDGDGKVDATGDRVEWSYEKPGSYSTQLTVIDVAGHKSVNATLTVNIKDVTPPSLVIKIMDERYAETQTFTETKRYFFDASNSSDNFDAVDNLTLNWSFGDGTTFTGKKTNHTYENYGTYTIVLNATDRAGNNATTNRTLYVQVDPSSRPDLSIEANSLKADPSSPEESTFFGTSIVKLTFNVSNANQKAKADSVTVTLYAFRTGESQGNPISVTPKFFYPNGTATVNTLEPGEKKRVEIEWVTGPVGSYTVKVNVTDLREPDIWRNEQNTIQQSLDVREAGWKRPAIYAAIAGLIVGGPVAIFLRRRYRAKAAEVTRITKKEKGEK